MFWSFVVCGCVVFFVCLFGLPLTILRFFAIESAVRQELLRVPLQQALDFLHSQILAILCVKAPRRPKGSQKIHSINPCPPTACYLVFPERASAGVPDPPAIPLLDLTQGVPQHGQFLLVDPWSGNYFDLEAAKFVKPIGIEHFFDAFSLEKKRPLKIDAASALNIQVKDVSDSLVVNQDKAKRFELTPVWAPAEPPAKQAKTAEVRLSSASNVPRPPKSDENEKGSSEEEDSDSSGSNSDVSSQDDSSDVSDLEKFDEAYTDFGALTKNVDPRTLERDGSANQNEEVPGIDLPGGLKALHSLANVPKSWPLARLTIPLSAASKHLERLLEGCCNEIYVRNTNPDLQLHFVRKFAKDLVVVLAFHLAETIAALFRHVLHHPSKVLYDPETEPLFLPLFWFYPIYREMLNSASRHRPASLWSFDELRVGW